MTEKKNNCKSFDLDIKPWFCPVCGLKRNVGNHVKCSKITQLKHQQERERAAALKS